jgi:enoyl-CoA hydratase/carnithine racemase
MHSTILPFMFIQKSSDGKEQHEQVFEACNKMINTIRHLPVPVIAEVKGLAAAAGCQLAASCDIVVAGENARFSTPG